MHVAYFLNQYPKLSHTFIRREIVALERTGLQISRFALRGWDDECLNADDASEQKKTRYVLRGGVLPMVTAAMAVLARSPVRSWYALLLALRTGRWSDRSILYHLIYLAEACLLLRWLRRCGADHVHAHFGTNAAEVLMLTRVLGGPPYSVTIHGPEEFDKPHALNLREKISRSAFTVAISSFARSQIYRWVDHAHWHKIKVIPCGIETAFHDGQLPRAPGDRRLVSIGRLSTEKGQLLLVEAAALLAAKSAPFELVLIGDGPMRNAIEKLVKERGLTDRVRVAGAMSSERVREEILNSRALVVSSFAEGLPIVIMEAMALRRPVLTTWIAGIPELVRDGIDGWLFPAGCVDSLASAMEDCLSRPVESLWVMGDAARERVLQRHSIEGLVVTLSAVFGHESEDVKGVDVKGV